jgi:colanic acid biosynthesis glycosyl transferase WcaI
MRLVFVNRFFHPDHSATSQLLTDLAFHFAAQGVAVRVITSRLRYDDASAMLPALEETCGVTISRVWSTRFGRGNLRGQAIDYLSFYFSAGWMTARLLRSGDVLIAKTDPPLLSILAMAVARLRGAKLVNWLQDIFPEVAGALRVRIGRGRLGTWTAALRDCSLRAAQVNVVLGERMAELLWRRGIPKERISIIHNWADDQAIVPVESAANPLIDEWGLSGRFVVGYSGNLGRVHEFDTILEAAALLQHDRQVVFLFVGSGAQSSMVEAEVSRRGLDNFVFRPYQPRERLSFSLGAATLHLVSLRPAMEGLIVPSKFYGIAAAGRPTAFIGDRDGEIGRMLRRHNCGQSFAVGDASGLAEFIRALASDPSEVRCLGRNARHALEANYSQANAFKAWEEMLIAVQSNGR